MDKEPYSFAELTDIIGIIFQWGSHQGGFMERIMLAWQTADYTNKIILQEPVDKLLRKYKLDVEARKLRMSNPVIGKASNDYLSRKDDLS